MRFVSLFSGIGASAVAWKGWECAAFAEISRFPALVLEKRFPSVKNFGDVRNIGMHALDEIGPFELLEGGSPCQDFSLSGNRAGLGGDRSSLFHEQLRIFDAARSICGTRFMLWENVTGALTTHGGRDFGAMVGSMVGSEFSVPSLGWGTSGVAIGPRGMVEWRIVDAQRVFTSEHPDALPQHRKRLFALLDAGDWSARAPVLLEPSCFERDPAESGAAGCDAGSEVPRGPSTRGQWPATIAPTLNAAFGKKLGLEDQHALQSAGLFVLSDDPERPIRRITHTEAERLMGFPDGHTDIGERGFGGDRYTALGNSIAINQMEWIKERLEWALTTS